MHLMMILMKQTILVTKLLKLDQIFSNQINIDLINELKYFGLNFKKSNKKLISNILINKSIVISGTLNFIESKE